MSVVSVSCPTAEISGIDDAAAARTTISSLNGIRSSRLPPPRATMRRSGRGIGPPGTSRLKPSIAAATCAAAPSPCTATGQSRTWRGKRSARRCRMSRMTAPVGEVTTPMTSGQKRQLLLALLGEESFGGETLLALLEQLEQGADPGELHRLDDELVFRAAGKGGEAPGADHLHPVLGLDLKAQRGAAPAHGVEHRLGVLEGEIAMARGVALEAGDLAAHPNIGEALLDPALQRRRKLAHRELGKVGRREAGTGAASVMRGISAMPAYDTRAGRR